MEDELKAKLNELLNREEILWRQKSRVKWLTTMDLNTKFFHISTTMRRRCNIIECLKFSQNNWTKDQNVIHSSFLDHFKTIYTTTNPSLGLDLESLFPKKVTKQNNDFLCKIPSEDEILHTRRQTPSIKALGPNGFTSLFYKHYWKIVKDDFNKVVHNFFQSSKLLKEVNQTHIALIPKTNSHNTIYQYKPISLSNICYKVIAKVLAKRLFWWRGYKTFSQKSSLLTKLLLFQVEPFRKTLF